MAENKKRKNIFLGFLCVVAVLVIILSFYVNSTKEQLEALAVKLNIDIKYETAEITRIKELCDENEKMSGAIIKLLIEKNMYDKNERIIKAYFSGPIFYQLLKLIAMNGNYPKETYASWAEKLEQENRNMKMFIKRLEHRINANRSK